MKSDAAVLFPGQGAQCAVMLDGVRNLNSFKGKYQTVCDALGFDPLSRLRDVESNDLINANAVSSLLTVLASVMSYEEWLTRNEAPAAISGYSVGQWTALYAASALSFDKLVQCVRMRAQLMDQCCEQQPGSMMAVIGVSPHILEDFCRILGNEGHPIVVSNYNCYGQYSLAGRAADIDVALARVMELKPKKAIKIPTSGAWHCNMMDGAAAAFRSYLNDVELGSLTCPVVNNVTGEFLPADPASLRDELARHVNHAVQWEKGIKQLVAHGCKRMVEVGYGNTLTKFGFFIDRTVTHSAYYPEAVLS